MSNTINAKRIGMASKLGQSHARVITFTYSLLNVKATVLF